MRLPPTHYFHQDRPLNTQCFLLRPAGLVAIVSPFLALLLLVAERPVSLPLGYDRVDCFTCYCFLELFILTHQLEAFMFLYLLLSLQQPSLCLKLFL